MSTGTAVEHGTGGAGFDIKWRFYEHETASLALKPGETLPTGDEARGLGAGKHNTSLFPIATPAPAPWEFDLHIDYVYKVGLIHALGKNIDMDFGYK